MWARNNSSAMCASGETSVAAISASPPYQHHCRHAGTGVPRSRSVRARSPYMTAPASAGASCSGATSKATWASTVRG